MISSFMDLHGIHKPVSTLLYKSQKLIVSTRYTTEKSHGLHDIKAKLKADILKLAYHQNGFSWLSGLEGEFQGLDL